MRRPAFLVCAVLALLAVTVLGILVFPARGASVLTETPVVQVYLPYVAGPQSTPTPMQTPSSTPSPTPTSTSSPAPIIWDPRLNLRGATLVPASVTPGHGYWKIVSGVWFDVNDVRPMGVGDHDIAFDVLDAAGVRQVGQTMKITWTTDGTCSTTNVALAGPELLGPATTTCIDRVYTQAKPGETYAGSYPMYHLAPTYSIAVEDGNPSDIAASLGLGSIAYPGFKMHTSYGFVWRWTIAGTTTPTGTLTATLTPGDAQTSTPTGTSTPGDTPTTTPTGTPTGTPTPGDTPNATPTGTPPPALLWDARLTQRGAVLVTAQPTPGAGYWRLVKGVWYDVGAGPNTRIGLIYVDALDAAGARKTGVLIRIRNRAGATVLDLNTEAKPGELYAANFPMWLSSPAYSAQPLNAPADAVYDMGLGSLDGTNSNAATGYGLVWQWTIAGGASASPTPPPSPTPSPTPAAYLFSSVSMPECRPQAGGTWFSGMLTLHGAPANGYRVVYSDTRDGVPITDPVISGPHAGYPGWAPGYYSHIISVNQAIVGDWYVWIVDQGGARISVIAHWHSSGPAFDQCSDATVNFDG